MDTRPVFADVYGHVPYAVAIGYGALSNTAYEPCEFPGCTRREPLQLDHCHAHGWVRGLICGSHNIRLGKFEGGPRLRGHRIDINPADAATYIARCPGCSGQPALPARGRFTSAYWPPLAAPVAVAGGLRAHLSARPGMTLCSRSREPLHSAPPSDLPMCGICERLAEFRRRWVQRLIEFE